MQEAPREKTREDRFRSLVERTEAAILSYALRRVPNREDAADVVAETFLVAWRRIDQMPKGDDARPWIFGVARNQVSNLKRGELRRGRLSSRLRQELVAASPTPAEPDTDLAIALLEALDSLSDDDREILTLLAWDDMRPADIAKVMGLRRATARSKIFRAKRRLEARLTINAQGAPGHSSNRPVPEENNA